MPEQANYSQACCACTRVTVVHQESTPGSVIAEWWQCRDCGRRFVPESRLREVEALLKIARQLNEAYKASEEKADAQYAALRADLAALVEKCLAYDDAIRSCADSPAQMASFCTAQGDDLDTLYAAWMTAARAVLERQQEGK